MRLVSNMRDESLETGYAAMLETPSIANRISFDCEEFKRGCAGFDVYGFYDKEMVGMTFLDGNHPHIAILKKHHGRCGKVIMQALSLFLKKSGNLIADVHKDNSIAISFVKKLGFRFVEVNNEIVSYRLGDDHVF